MKDQVIKAMNKLLSYNSDDLRLCVHVSEDGKTLAYRQPLINDKQVPQTDTDTQDKENK